MSNKYKMSFLLGVAIAGFAVPAAAQDAGDAYVRVAAARTKLVDKGTIKVDGVVDPTAGYVTRETFHGVVSGGYYVIDHVAIDGSISTPATTDNTPAGSLAGVPNLGDDEFMVATIGASVHPFKGKFSPYVGGGMQFQFTTQERDGLGVGLNVPNSHGPYINAGVDYKVSNTWGVFADVRKAWYHTNATGLLPHDASYTTFSAVDAIAELDPLTIQVGLTAHFGKNDDTDIADFLSGPKKFGVKVGMSTLELRDHAEMVVGGVPLVNEGISTREHQTPSVQLSYFFNENIAFNATLGFPPKIDIFAAGRIGGLPKLGEVRYGPTAFTMQYHPTVSGRFRPYVGAGISYMIVFDEKDGAFENLNVKNDLSLAFEVGTDILLGKDWGLFLDVKKAFLRPGVTGTFDDGDPLTNDDVVTKTKLDPWVFSAGLSFKL